MGTFLDLRDRVTRTFEGSEWNEMGLLGIVFHPDFANNGYVYVYYSAIGTAAGWPLEARLSRFTSHDGGLTADPNSEVVILKTDRDTQWHWGGKLAFGDDGYLYASFGEAGRHRNAQDLTTLKGKMIRIDVDGGSPYGIPLDNPYASGGGRPEIYASGLRNPWRWNFDRVTGEIWLGDVGLASYEEVDIIQKGGNYGWSIREGAHCSNLVPCTTAGLIEPIYEYLQRHHRRLRVSWHGFAESAGRLHLR